MNTNASYMKTYPYRQFSRTYSRTRGCVATFSVMISILSAPPIAFGEDAPLQTNLPHETSWLGNTFGGADEKWVQNYVDEIEVSPDGTVYTASEWDEGGRCAGIYKDGEVMPATLKQFDGKGGHKAWGWGTAGHGVAIDDTRIYLINTAGELLRFNRADHKFIDSTPVLEITKVGDKEVGKAVGLTCAGGMLYIIRDNGEIKVLAVSDLKLQHAFTIPGARDVAVAADGTLWVLAGTEILHYSASGEALPQKISDAGKPTAIAFGSQGRLLVCDNGPRRQVLIYEVKDSPRQVGTFGVPGGITAGPRPGEVAPHKLHSLAGASTDAQGNLYVAMSAGMLDGTVLRQFKPDDKGGWDALGWELNGLTFTDSIVTEPGSKETSVYSHAHRFVMDYSKPPGQQWKVAGYTLDPDLQKVDIRREKPSYHPAFVARLEGKVIVYMREMMGGSLEFYSPRPGTEFLDPIYSHKPQLEGWGVSVDERGDIWECSGKTIARFPFEGFAPDGAPRFGKRQDFDAPASWDSLQRVYYNSTTDTLFLAGYTSEKKDETWGLIGKEMARYDGWLKGTRTATWTKAVPHDFKPKEGPRVIMKSMSIAGDYLFMVGVDTRAQVRVFDMRNGDFVGMLEPGEEVGGVDATGWIDMVDAIYAVKRENGEYLVFVEEDHNNKIILYRWTPKP